jgi:hypothetical protein
MDSVYDDMKVSERQVADYLKELGLFRYTSFQFYHGGPSKSIVL